MTIRVKICGITQATQAQSILAMGADALGFICVESSPRYLSPATLELILHSLPSLSRQGNPISTIGVFANPKLPDIQRILSHCPLTGIQLHGHESIKDCQILKTHYPDIELIKAFRIKDDDTLRQAHHYESVVDTFLFDTYHPHALGGTGETWNWSSLNTHHFDQPWLLAGGLSPQNVLDAIAQGHPSGIDLSSGVEQAPGIKDLSKVKQLFEVLSTSDVR